MALDTTIIKPSDARASASTGDHIVETSLDITQPGFTTYQHCWDFVDQMYKASGVDVRAGGVTQVWPPKRGTFSDYGNHDVHSSPTYQAAVQQQDPRDLMERGDWVYINNRNKADTGGNHSGIFAGWADEQHTKAVIISGPMPGQRANTRVFNMDPKDPEAMPITFVSRPKGSTGLTGDGAMASARTLASVTSTAKPGAPAGAPPQFVTATPEPPSASWGGSNSRQFSVTPSIGLPDFSGGDGAPDAEGEANTQGGSSVTAVIRGLEAGGNDFQFLDNNGASDSGFQPGLNGGKGGFTHSTQALDPNKIGISSAWSGDANDIGQVKRLIVDTASQTPNVRPGLALAMAQQESGFHQFSSNGSVLTSGAGARGLMQLMPGTARGLRVDPDNIGSNVVGGVSLMSQLIKKYNGNEGMALAAYNWGEGNLHGLLASGVAWNGADTIGLPAETRAYVRNITALADGYDTQVAALRSPTAPQGSSQTAALVDPGHEIHVFGASHSLGIEKAMRNEGMPVGSSHATVGIGTAQVAQNLRDAATAGELHPGDTVVIGMDPLINDGGTGKIADLMDTARQIKDKYGVKIVIAAPLTERYQGNDALAATVAALTPTIKDLAQTNRFGYTDLNPVIAANDMHRESGAGSHFSADDNQTLAANFAAKTVMPPPKDTAVSSLVPTAPSKTGNYFADLIRPFAEPPAKQAAAHNDQLNNAPTTKVASDSLPVPAPGRAKTLGLTS